MAHFTPAERDKYFGKPRNAIASFTDRNASPMDHRVQREAFLRRAQRVRELPITGSSEPLNAILAEKWSLFPVTLVTLLASNVTHFTQNGDIAQG